MIGKAVDEFIRAGVAQFVTDEPLDIGFVRAQTCYTCLQFGILRDLLIAQGGQFLPPFAQSEKIAWPEPPVKAPQDQRGHYCSERQAEPFPPQIETQSDHHKRS